MKLSGFATRVALGVVVVAMMLALVADPAQAGWRNRVYVAPGYGYGYPVATGYTTVYSQPMPGYYAAPAQAVVTAPAVAPTTTATTTTTVAPVDTAVAPAAYAAPAGYSATTVTTSPTMYQTQYIGSPYYYGGPTMIQRRGLFGRTRFVYPRTVFAY
jgi:hypothetical protein